MDAQLRHKIPAGVLKIIAWRRVKFRRQVHAYVNEVWWQRNSFDFQGVKIEKGLEADIMQMFKCFILRGKKTRTLLILSGSCDKALKGKRMFFCFHFAHFIGCA